MDKQALPPTLGKIALFVEGKTEALFATKLIEEIAGRRVTIQQIEIRGGSSVPRSITQIRAIKPETGDQYFVLIVDCGSDDQVKSRIIEEHSNLTKSGYQKIIGIRDVRPQFTFADIPELGRGLRKYIKTSLIPVQFILCVMEIEAWFLAETSHFERIDPSITVAEIIAQLRFDPEHDDLQLRPEPAVDLDNCYAIGGKTYIKGSRQITIDSLDFAAVYLTTCQKFSHLQELIESIDSFLTTE